MPGPKPLVSGHKPLVPGLKPGTNSALRHPDTENYYTTRRTSEHVVFEPRYASKLLVILFRNVKYRM